LRECNLCKANVVISSIAVSHRTRAERAIEARAWRDAISELAEMEFILTHSSELLGPAAQWFDWARENLDSAKANVEKARKLAAAARESASGGLLSAATRKMQQAAHIDPTIEPEYLELAARAGIAPEARPVGDAAADVSNRFTRRFDELTSGARQTSGAVRPDSSRTRSVDGSTTRRQAMAGGIKVRCDACNAGFISRTEVLEKQKACPKCGATPFKWTQKAPT
jgi:hypothetical protein